MGDVTIIENAFRFLECPYVVVLNGVASHGKNTFSRLVREMFKGTVVEHSTVDTVKDVARRFGANEEHCKGDAERRLWSDLKDAWTRYNNGPFNEVLNEVEAAVAFFGKAPLIFFAHVREPEEILKLKLHFREAMVSVLVYDCRKSAMPDNHADQGVLDYDEYDFIINNDGSIEDLRAKAARFLVAVKWPGFLSSD